MAPGWRRAAAAAGMIVLYLAPVAGRAADQTPYTIDAILPLTGSGAFIGKAEAGSLGLVEDLVNRTGGIAGRPLKFNIKDDQTNAQLAVQLMNGVVAEKAPVVLGSAVVASCNAMAAVSKDTVVQYCLSPAMHPPNGSFSYSAGFSTKDLLSAFLRFIREHGWKKIAVMTSNDATGQDADAGIADALAAPENAGESVVDHEHFAPGDLTVTAQVARIKASGAQVMIAWTTGTPFGTVLRSANDGGLTIPVVTTSGNMTYPQMKAYESFMSSTVYFPSKPAFAVDQVSNPAMKKAIIDFLAAFKAAGIQPDEGYISAWDAALIVVDAIRKNGPNATAQQIHNFISSQKNWTGVNGSYDFTAPATRQRGLDIKSVVIVRWDPAESTWVAASNDTAALARIGLRDGAGSVRPFAESDMAALDALLQAAYETDGSVVLRGYPSLERIGR